MRVSPPQIFFVFLNYVPFSANLTEIMNEKSCFNSSLKDNIGQFLKLIEKIMLHLAESKRIIQLLQMMVNLDPFVLLCTPNQQHNALSPSNVLSSFNPPLGRLLESWAIY